MPMRIRITDLPATGLSIEESFPETSINKRVQEGEDNQFFFTEPLHANISVKAIGETCAEVKGSVKTNYTQGCSLCLECVPRAVEIPLSFQLRQQNEAGTFEDDIGISIFNGEHAELDPIIEEEILLSLSLFWHPALIEDRCTQCHKNRGTLGIQEEVKAPTLGALFQNLKKEITSEN